MKVTICFLMALMFTLCYLSLSSFVSPQMEPFSKGQWLSIIAMFLTVFIFLMFY